MKYALRACLLAVLALCLAALLGCGGPAPQPSETRLTDAPTTAPIPTTQPAAPSDEATDPAETALTPETEPAPATEPAPETEPLPTYPQMEPRDTRIWMDGTAAGTWTLPQGGCYVRLAEAAEAGDGSLEVGDQGVTLTAWGQTLRFAGDGTEAPAGRVLPPVVFDGTEWYGLTGELLPALGLMELADPELDQLYYTKIVRNDRIPTGCRVPVLMYHAVSDDLWGISELFVSPSRLEQQLQALVEGGYTAITFEDLDRIDQIEKPVMLTFDDGYDDNYTNLFPLLQKYNVKATVFMIVNDIGKNHKLTTEQIQEMAASGLVSFQSHTMSHGYLSDMSESRLHSEHYDSMLALARITGKQPFVLCYPSGRNNGYTRRITAQYYQFGLDMSGPCYVTGEAPYLIYRYYIARNTSLETFLRDLSG